MFLRFIKPAVTFKTPRQAVTLRANYFPKPVRSRLPSHSPRMVGTTNSLVITSHLTPPLTTYSFVPKFQTVAQFSPTALEKDFANEKSMYSANIDFVKQHGGPMANFLLGKIPKSYYDAAKDKGLFPNIDIRVHKFEKYFFGTPGLEFFPAIPGLHCDGEWRETYFSQPDLNKIPVSHHLIATIATEPGISNTQFLLDKISLPVETATSEYTLWEQVDKFARKNPNLRFQKMQDGCLTLFDARSLHEATSVKFPGCRLFFRCSMWHRPNLGEGGQLSLNEQLYTVFTPALISANDYRTTTIQTTPQYKVIGNVPPVMAIGELAKEPGLINATPDFVRKHGGLVANSLLRKVPHSFFDEALRRKLNPKIDFFVYRLYPSYQPDLPGYDQKLRLAGWNLPVDQNNTSILPTPEIHISLSTHVEGVNKTELLMSGGKITIPYQGNCYYFWNNFNKKIADSANSIDIVSIKDGDVVLTSSHTARRETPTVNRGWRAMFRVSMQESQKDHQLEGETVKQQYVSIPYASKGW